MTEFSTAKLARAWCAGKPKSCNPRLFRTTRLLRLIFRANKECDPMSWLTWLLQSWHVHKLDFVQVAQEKVQVKMCNHSSPYLPSQLSKSHTADLLHFCFSLSEVHNFVPHVTIAYPVLPLPRLRVPAWCAPQSPSSWGRRGLEGESATEDVTTKKDLH